MPVAGPANSGIERTVRSPHRIKRKDISLDRDGDMSLWRDWRRHTLEQCAPTHFRKHQDVKEMHGAEHEHDHADLATDRFEHLADIDGSDVLLQSKRYVADVDQVKTHHQKVIDRIGQTLVSTERIDQKNAPVFMQRLCYPNGERNAQRDVNNVSPNYRSHRSFLSLVFIFNGNDLLVSKASGPREPFCSARTG